MKKKVAFLFVNLVFASSILVASPFMKIIQDSLDVAKDQKKYHGMIMFDPIGFITLGPSIHIEPGIGKYVGIDAGLRLQNLGILQNAFYGSMNMSYMVHFSLRYYVKPKQQIDGFFLGPGIEYGRSNYTSGKVFGVRAFGGGLGYKWVFKNGFCLTLGDYIGIVQSKRIDDQYDYDWKTDMFVFYLLSVQIGITF
jgi:hypothetical protein